MTRLLRTPHVRCLLAAALLALCWVQPASASAESTISDNDVARILAGLPPSPNSPLAEVARQAAWKSHARAMDAAWASLERRQLSKIRDWSAANLPSPRNTLYYMFSGPDFLYADTFYPHATTYLLSGLEVIGQKPSVTGRSLGSGLAQLRSSINSVLSYSFFRTREMRITLGENTFSGTLPIIYIFLARTGKTIEDVTLFDIDENGAMVTAGIGRPRDAAQGVKIRFSGADGRPRTLFYVRTDVSNGGLAKSGFLAFLAGHGPGDGLVKSASYLMHSKAFSRIRDFLLEKTERMVEDDSGIPVSYFEEAGWKLRPFGRYLGPIGLFPDNYQTRLAAVFRRNNPPRLTFGIGYRYQPNESNLLVAERGRKAAK